MYVCMRALILNIINRCSTLDENSPFLFYSRPGYLDVWFLVLRFSNMSSIMKDINDRSSKRTNLIELMRILISNMLKLWSYKVKTHELYPTFPILKV